MMLFKDFQDYIRELCRQNKLIRHGMDGRKSFFRMDGEEALAAIPNNAASPYVIVAGFGGRMLTEGMGKMELYAELIFLSKASAQKGSRADENERAFQEAFEVMMQFIARIMENYERDEGCGPIQNLFPERMDFEKLGPLHQLGYGWSLTIPFRTSFPAYDQNDWEV